jgi:CheY-like chemotaxis protein
MKPLALVIENDAGTRKLLDVLLTRVGLDVDLVPTGTDALIVLQHVRYDVLIIDLLLPGTTGFQILSWLEETHPGMLARSLVLSSSTPAQLNSVRERWPEVRAIRKPFELGEVIELVQLITASCEPREMSALEKFCRHSIRTGAKAGVVVAVKGDALEPVLSYGYTREMLEAFPLTVDGPYPLCKAVRHDKPLWLASLVMAAPEYPMLAPVFEANQSRALAALPLTHQGRVVGAVGWSFREPRLFSEAEQNVFAAIARAIPDWLGLQGTPSHSTASA